MEKYIQPSTDEIVIGFVASCIESVADRLGVGYREIFERMEKVGMIDEYIYPCYETLTYRKPGEPHKKPHRDSGPMGT